ncbi:hypothetical protein F2Q69_00009486 [Brassica cretica]|uniref:Uncharacterized protein n=1 Tax=Brassica cretica TaxID=69181 RepID=A0A8S9PFK6_BRACR|nr:hypothetical protein F2Q69_00009486 [Brassica cretica]
MTNDNDTPIDTTDVIQTPLNAAATDATGVTTAAATTSTILPARNAADETTRRSLFGVAVPCLPGKNTQFHLTWFSNYPSTNTAFTAGFGLSVGCVIYRVNSTTYSSSSSFYGFGESGSESDRSELVIGVKNVEYTDRTEKETEESMLAKLSVFF